MEEESVKHDDIFDFAIYYSLHDGSYPDGLNYQREDGMLVPVVTSFGCL